MGKVKKKTFKKKWDFEQFELVRVVQDDATADESWIGLDDAGKLADSEIESYGMFLKVRGKYLIIARSKATDPKDDLIEGTLRIPVQIIKSVEEVC